MLILSVLPRLQEGIFSSPIKYEIPQYKPLHGEISDSVAYIHRNKNSNFPQDEPIVKFTSLEVRPT